MTECILAWGCIITSIITKEPMWAVASALFAIAIHIGNLKGG